MLDSDAARDPGARRARWWPFYRWTVIALIVLAVVVFGALMVLLLIP